MGNLLEPSSSNYFLREVTGDLVHLTKCNSYSGSVKEIVSLQAKLSTIQMLHNCYVAPESVKKLLKSTPKDALHSLITRYFTYKPTNKVNMMEVLAGLIAYAECPWDVKINWL